MRRRVYRSLDRPASIFGIKGRFMLLVGAGAGLSAVVGIIIGKVTSMLAGIGVVLLLMLGVYFLTTSLQARIDEKDIWKVVIRKSYPEAYRVRPKPLRTVWKGFNMPFSGNHDK